MKFLISIDFFLSDKDEKAVSSAKLFELSSSYLDVNPQLTPQPSPCCDDVFVPDIILVTVDIPHQIDVVGNGTIIQSR